MPSDKCIPKLNNKKKFYISHFTLGFYLVLGTRLKADTTKVASDNFTIGRWALGSCCLGKSLWESA